MPIEWNEEVMTTGIPEVDAQHKEWIRRFNQFEDAVLSRHGTEAIHDALRFFLSYAATHFPFEESWMEKLNCPSAELNQAAHARFREKIQAMEDWIQAEGASLVEVIELKVDMEQWLVDHICKIDSQLRTVAGRREPPQG